MATRFMRIDLSDSARDFRPVAVEPGVPLLDYSGANDRIVFRWLGGMAAQPEWEGESVNYYVRDDHGGRLEDAVCQPVATEELEKLFEKDLAALRDRIDKARPETATERELKKTLRRSFEDLVDDPNRSDHDTYFFRYKDAQGHWRLVWCWGYQRVDQEPAPAVVCTDENCQLLFVRRPGQSPKCPACEAALAAKPVKRTPWKRIAALLLLLLLLGTGFYYWWTHPNRLIATPGETKGPVGSRVQFTVTKAGLFFREDVTSQAVGVVSDPRVARFDQLAVAATFVGPGKAVVTFHVGDLESNATLISGFARNPKSIRVEPENVELGIGTTARLRLIGTYDDGEEADLTAAAEWLAQNDGIVFSYEGLLEGLSEGTTSVAARYRSGPDSDFLDASTTVTVKNIPFKGLELAIEPLPVALGGASNLQIDAVSEPGKKYSVLESSRLATEVSPGYRAEVDGRHLVGRNLGKAKLAVTFNGEHSAGTEFDVVAAAGLDRLVVLPKELDMVVGEITDLSVASPSAAPIEFRSSDPATLEITAENRLIARSEGQATVEVSQGAQRETATVTITAVEFASLAVAPDPLKVLVDHTVRARALAKIAGEEASRDVEIAPDLLEVTEKPSPRFADFKGSTLELRGVAPTTTSSPQQFAVRLGDLAASAAVEVVVAPLRLALKPVGPVDLPLGQQMRLQGWANYSGGHRVQVPSARLEFHGKETVEGLELRSDRVAALKPKVGPLNVYATYFGNKSNDVSFHSTEAGPVTLELDIDRDLLLAGETGKITLRGRGPHGDVELVPDLATFSSSDDTVLKIAEKTGAFRTAAPGQASVTGNHLAAKEPASRQLKVFDPANARLVFDPPAVRLTVDELARLQLYLEVDDGTGTQRAELSGPGVGFAMTQPKAVRYRPPLLVGLEPAPAFELSGSFTPHLSRVARAQVEVVETATPEAIRIVPGQLELAAGQTLALRVEELLPGQPDAWREVRPGAVAWEVPSSLVWTAPSAGLSPTVTMPEGAAAGPLEITARYAGAAATATVAPKEAGPDLSDPAARVRVVRDPPGRYLPVGAQQRYSVVVEKGDTVEPAANVVWPDAFENEYVAWQAPVLTAKRSGHQQWLRAEVEGRTVLLHTTTYEPGRFERSPAVEPGDRPDAVKIVSDQGPSVRVPVGASFDDFRVEALYTEPDGSTFTRLVTGKARFITPEGPQDAPVAAENGHLVGLKPGQTSVTAEFEGVRAEEPLAVTVTADVDADQIRIDPAPLYLEPGESYPLTLYAYKQGQSLGDISGLGGIAWQSTNPQVADVAAGQATGVAEGQGKLTAQFGGLTSSPTDVIVGEVDDLLVINPQPLVLRVGETARLGSDVTVMRGNLDLSNQVRVTPALQGFVSFDPATRSLVGLRPGPTPVAISHGDNLVNLMVEVTGDGAVDGQVVVDPGAVNLVPGQMFDPRVYVVTPEGERIDRTASAVLTSSDPTAVTVQGTRLLAAGPGMAQITATVAGAQQPGMAHVTVVDEDIVELVIEPPQAMIYAGEQMPFTVLGRSSAGLRPMAPSPELQITKAGANPEAIDVAAGHTLQGVSPGEALLVATWKNAASAQATVSVTQGDLGRLEIQPATAAVRPGQSITYQVIGSVNGQPRALTRADGVELFVDNPTAAQVSGSQMAVLANQPGRVTVIARLGNQEAEAVLDVTAGDAPPVIGHGDLGDGGLVDGDLVDGALADGGYYDDADGYVRDYDGYGGGYGGVYDDVDVLGFDRRGGYWDDDLGRYVYDDDRAAFAVPPLLAAEELRFEPEVLRLAQNSPPTPVRVFELLPNGTLGRDVTNDPNLNIAAPPDTVRVERTEAGILVAPLAPGETTVAAKYEAGDDVKLASPLVVSVGSAMTPAIGAQFGQLIVTPNPLGLWAGQTGTFSSVMLDPGAGQLPRPIDYRITTMPGEGVVAPAGDKLLRGLAGGTAQVMVTAIDPTGVYDGLSTRANVQVTAGDPISIHPATVMIQVGQPVPPLTVMARSSSGTTYAVPSQLTSMSPTVVAPDPTIPGRLVARQIGTAQLKAQYQGREAFAEVQVTGKRFVSVVPQLHEGPDDFSVKLTVLAEGSEGPLEYRTYPPGTVPVENWVPSQPAGEYNQVELQSPRMPFKSHGALYQLMIEARPAGGGSAQKYPYTFRLKSDIEEMERPNPPATTPIAPPLSAPSPEPAASPSPVPGFEGT